MGFLNGLITGLSGNASGKEVLNNYKEEDEDSLVRQSEGKKNDYRSRAFENSQSVGGKYQCVRCKKWSRHGKEPRPVG